MRDVSRWVGCGVDRPHMLDGDGLHFMAKGKVKLNFKKMVVFRESSVRKYLQACDLNLCVVYSISKFDFLGHVLTDKL